MKHREAHRRRLVRAERIEHITENDSLFPKHLAEKGLKEFWTVSTRIRRGLMPESVGLMEFYSEDEAASFLEKYKEWRSPEYTGGSLPSSENEVVREIIQNAIYEGKSLGFFGEIDDDFFEVWQVLVDSGVSNGLRPTRDVLSFLGESSG